MKKVESNLPIEIQDIWKELENEVVWLHGRWTIFRQLFGKSEERVELLNNSAGTFFNVLQFVLLRDVQLAICRLGDPAKTRGKTNLTLRALLEILSRIGQPELVDTFRQALETFDMHCAKIRDRRNKWIAHSDLDTLLARSVVPLTHPSRQEVETALESIRDCMNSVNLYYSNSTTAYEHFSMLSDGESLVRDLQRAARYKELVSYGVISRADLRTRFK